MNSVLPSEAPTASLAAQPAATPSFRPLYQQIRDLILRSLQQGEWKPAEVIPSEMELAARFGVSQGTVRKAIAEQQVQYRFLRLMPDVDQADAEQPAQREIVECKRARATADVARALALKTGESIIQARRVLSFGGIPTIVEDLWLPGEPFRGLTAHRLSAYPGSLYAFFESEFGVRMVRADEKIRAVLPDVQQAALLQIPVSTPLLSVERIAFTYGNRPMELRKGLYRTDSRHYHNRLS